MRGGTDGGDRIVVWDAAAAEACVLSSDIRFLSLSWSNVSCFRFMNRIFMVAPERRFGVALDSCDVTPAKIDPEPWRGDDSSFVLLFFFFFEFFPDTGGDAPGFHMVMLKIRVGVLLIVRV
jgi:hypothetical protein